MENLCSTGFLRGFAAAIALGALNLAAQQSAPIAVQAIPGQPVARPLTAMPYSPSLDVTSMDRSVDPCVDFYKFSCGGWQKNNPIPADQAAWSVYAKLANENQQFLWGILAEDAQAKDRTPVQQKVGDYFAACMNTDAIDALGDKPVRAELARIDGLKTRAELIAALTRLHHEWAGSYFFGSVPDLDAVDSSTVIVEVGGGGLGLPDRDYYTKTDDKSVKIRAQYAEYMQQLLGLAGETADQAKADADAVLRIETALARASLTRVERRDPYKTYHMETIEDLGKQAPSIDWADYFKVQGCAWCGRRAEREPTGVYEGEFESELTQLRKMWPRCRAYLRFHLPPLLTAAAPRTLRITFEQVNFDFFSKTLRSVPAMPPAMEDVLRGRWTATWARRWDRSLCGGHLRRRRKRRRWR